MLNTRGLDQILKALKNQSPRARVGILGDKNTRTSGEMTNADIGAKHEFGDNELPMRSFLRQPITEQMQNFLNKSKFFDKASLRELIRSGSIVIWLKKIGVVGEAVVQEGFATGGFGKWKKSNMTHKKVHQTLIETAQLRNSITSDVKE